MGIIYETSLWAFILITVFAGGSAAFMIGRAAAKGWKPFWQAAFYTMLLGAAIQLFHWGLFAGAVFAGWRDALAQLLHYYAAGTMILMAFAALGFRLYRRGQMLRQYGWLATKRGPLGWRLREDATTEP
ncbi:MAG: DUF6867 family protein [Rhodomicrobium sp.]